MTTIKIAAAIPTYRRPEFLLQLTRSISSTIQISVSDNDSSLSGQIDLFGNNVHIHHADELLPIFANWNRALSYVAEDATHVLIPSDDDLYLESAFKTVQEAIIKYPDADMIIFGCDLVDEYGNQSLGWCPEREEFSEHGNGFLHFVNGVRARMPGVLFKTQFLQNIGGFDERFQLTAADSELIQRAALLGKTVFIPKVIGLYRVWGGSLTHARQATDLWMDEVALWTEKIATLLQNGHQPPKRAVNVDRFRDEIFALNLLAGLDKLNAKGQSQEARDFLKRHPMPRCTTVRTWLRMLRMRWLLWREPE